MIAGIVTALLWTAGKTKIPAGVIAGVIVLGLAIGAWLAARSVYNHVYSVCDAKWTETVLEAKIKKLEQELEAARRSKESDDRNDAELEAERDELQKKVDTYEQERKKRGDYCPLGDDAVGLR